QLPWIRQIDPPGRPDVGEVLVSGPRRDAAEMMIVEIARPPGDAGRVPREESYVLSGAAAGLEHIACLAAQEFFENRPDRDMVAVKRRRVETVIGCPRPAVVADVRIVGHGTLPFIPAQFPHGGSRMRTVKTEIKPESQLRSFAFLSLKRRLEKLLN